MHELAIAEGILGVTLEEARGRPVRKVHVVVGHLRQVVPSALTFGFELVSRGTIAEGAELELEEVPAAGRCRACGIESVMETFPLRCNCCGGMDMELVRGRELRVDWLEIEETGTEGGSRARQESEGGPGRPGREQHHRPGEPGGLRPGRSDGREFHGRSGGREDCAP